ncbi:MAG: efflux RND transporter periplasmic adaptor subunit, partial [Candidatus Abyssubacteria bacterium]|nr:efflux RND transporter periplasmic adaptor subunit [Candidatus Abyssubacteria bacterium]
MRKLLLMKVLPTAAVLLLGVFIANRLVASRPMPEVAPKTVQGTLVEIMEAKPERQLVRVEAMGTVIPSRELELTPEVSGRIVGMNPNLVP